MHASLYIATYIQTQVYAQNEELRSQLEESKRIESFLQDQISKVELKFSNLRENYDKLSGEDIEAQLKIMQRRMFDVKSEFSSIDVIKLHWIEEVHM